MTNTLVRDEALNRLSQRLTALGFAVKDVTVDLSASEVTLGFGDLHNVIDFFESTALKASQQGNTPLLRLSATLGDHQHSGAVTWPLEDTVSVLAAWRVR